MIFINRKKTKQQIKNTLSTHFSFFWKLFLPGIILTIFYESLDADSKFQPAFNIDDGLELLFTLIVFLLTTGVMFVGIDMLRGKSDYQHPFRKSVFILSNGRYFIGTIMIGILKMIWILLWSLLLIFPGIIKGLAYSQAYFIYRDSADQGQPIKYHEAITKSRHLMNGHKWELFVLNLSFLGWFIINFITCGIANFWVMPYYRLTLAHFYQALLDNQKSQH